MEISESNKLMGEFLGGHYKTYDIDARYHDDLNFLFKVITKCKAELSEMTEKNKTNWGNKAYGDILSSIIDFSGIEKTYDAVLVFIRLYNDHSYPFKEGDDYWTIEDNLVIWSNWDDVSEELYSPNTKYYKTMEDALLDHYKSNHTQDQVALIWGYKDRWDLKWRNDSHLNQPNQTL